jgi:hypothetical protein
VLTVVVSIRAYPVQRNILMRMTFAAKSERLALSFFESCDWAADSLVDNWTRVRAQRLAINVTQDLCIYGEL